MTRSAIISILALALLAAACGPVATGPSATASGPAAASTPHSPAPTPSAGAVPEDLSSIWFRKTDTTMQWDAAALNCQRVEQLLKLPTEGDAVLIFDDTGFLKQGGSSVGVALQ